MANANGNAWPQTVLTLLKALECSPPLRVIDWE
jgi:hypothetical protein